MRRSVVDVGWFEERCSSTFMGKQMFQVLPTVPKLQALLQTAVFYHETKRVYAQILI